MTYVEWNREAAIECWGEEDIPCELLELLDKNKTVIEFGTEVDSNYESKKLAISEIEFAKELIAEDLHICFFMNEKEATEFSWAGHQSIEANIAVKNILEEISE